MGIADAPKASRWYYSFLPNGIAGGVTQPAIPLYATEALGGGVAEAGVIVAATSVTSVPAFMFWGTASDAMRRRRLFVIIGFVGMALSLFFMAVAANLREYYIANLLMGALAAASAPVGPVLIIETARQEEWPQRLAVFNRIGGFGWVAGLGIGALWMSVETAGVGAAPALQGLFVIGGALALLSAVLAWRWIPEPEVTIDRKLVHIPDLTLWFVEKSRFLPQRMLHFFDPRHLVGGAKLSPSLRRYLATTFLLFSGFTAFYAIFPIFLVRVAHVPMTQVFAAYLVGHLVSALSYPFMGRWVAYRGGKHAQVVASGARAVLFPAVFLLAFVPASAVLPALLVLHGAIGVCWAAINVSGSMLVSQLADPTARAEAMGAYHAMQGFGSIFGPVAIGVTAGVLGYGAGFLGAAALVAGGAYVLYRLNLAPAPTAASAISAVS